MKITIIININIIIEYSNCLSNFKYNNIILKVFIQNFSNETNSSRFMLISKFIIFYNMQWLNRIQIWKKFNLYIPERLLINKV